MGMDAARFLVARTLEASVGPHDLLADWGEKGFRVGTHPASEEALGELGWKLAALAHASSLEWWGDPLSLTLSVGIAPAAAGDTLQTLEARVAKGILEID